MKQFCKRGHDTYVCGRTSSGGCRLCVNLAAVRYRATHREKRREYRIKYWQNPLNRAKDAARAAALRVKRRELLTVLKDKPCADCLIKYPRWVMQFDHLRDKKFGIGGKQNQGLGALLAEIAKCEVVCANCHAERTHQRRQLASL